MFGNGATLYVVEGTTDLRKGIDGLSAIVVGRLKMDPFKGVYLFSNTTRDRIKILQWDYNGFWLHVKRLEGGRFKWPSGDAITEMNSREVERLLSGLHYNRTYGHREVEEREIF